MFENDSIQAFHQTKPKKPAKAQAMGLPATTKRDEFIMDTNSSSIVSKRSVEKLYYPDQPSYFRYFVRKFQRRSPLINRGYWLRMKAIEKTVVDFLSIENGKTKVVVNLGCGYDPLPFQFLGIRPELCREAVFVDVDYPQLLERKVQVIKGETTLSDLLPDLVVKEPPATILANSPRYKAIGCDLKDVSNLERALQECFDLDRCAVAILFVAEVSVAYMEKAAANSVLAWAAGLTDSTFCLLEQHLPDGVDHPFAQTMLRHFEKLRTPLHAIGTLDDMRHRFLNAGWDSSGLSIRSLWELWSDNKYISPSVRCELDSVEPFDEWEEFVLFASHYFLLVAEGKQASVNRPARPQDDVSLNHPPPTNKTVSIEYNPVSGTDTRRRFGAAARSHSRRTILHYGGLGLKERVKTSDRYNAKGSHGFVSEHTNLPTNMPAALMCHTINPVGNGQLLVGGRTSPDRANAACWFSEGSTWRQEESIPRARYRHCAVSVRLPTNEHDGLALGIDASEQDAVLVFGGRASADKILDDWLLWSQESGWAQLSARIVGGKSDGRDPSFIKPRFGATLVVLRSNPDSVSGTLSGGMGAGGVIIDDQWNWRLVRSHHAGFEIIIEDSSDSRPPGSSLTRFGAQVVQGASGPVIVGGVGVRGVLARHEEVVGMNVSEKLYIESSQRPLLIGCSVVSVAGGILLLGGGATCFSFGTCWNQSGVLLTAAGGSNNDQWTIQESGNAPSSETCDIDPLDAKHCSADVDDHIPIQAPGVTRQRLSNASDFVALSRSDTPAVLEGIHFGSCTSQWTIAYLREKVGSERAVVIHDCPDPNMSFHGKNFQYTKTTFGDFLNAVEEGKHVYLRALSSEKPAEAATSLEEDFASIADDFQLPPELEHVRTHAHSSPLRISGPVNMWLHYDVMANVLCQIRGSKRVVLFPPSDVRHLSIPAGGSTSPFDPFGSSMKDKTALDRCHPHEVVLKEGDVLFIPPLWLHAAQPLSGLSIAVNVFFRDDRMEVGYAAGRDVYGNRDIAAYERGRRDVQRVAKSFDGLPAAVRDFYLCRLADELQTVQK